MYLHNKGKQLTLTKDIDYVIKKEITDKSIDFYITFKGNYEGVVKKSVNIKDSENMEVVKN